MHHQIITITIKVLIWIMEIVNIHKDCIIYLTNYNKYQQIQKTLTIAIMNTL